MLKTTLPPEAREGLPATTTTTTLRRVPAPPDPVEATMLTLIPMLIGALVGLMMLGGLALALVSRTGGLGALADALVGPHSAWYLSRASGFAAFLLLWWSMALGLAITNRMAKAWPGGPSVGDLHEHASLLGLAFTALHALVLLRDQYIGYTLAQVLVPFGSSSYEPLWVGVGQIGIYLMALVTISSYIRRWIGPRSWRLLHYLSYLAFVLALGHGIFSGSDTRTGWATAIYAASGLSLLVLTIYRVMRPPRAAPTRAVQ